MKIRNDFVSNSSSSSFIIDGCDLSKLHNVFSNIFQDNKNDIFYAWDDRIRINLRCKNKNYVKVWKTFKPSDECPFKNYYNDFKTQKQVLKDPEDQAWEPITIAFNNIFKLAGSILSKIDHLNFEAEDDYNQEDIGKLRLLYKFLEAAGCNPDATNSEHDFLNDDSDILSVKMIQFIANKKENKKENKDVILD